MDTPTTIEYSDFQKLDIRVGHILKAETVPKSEKLLRLEVDFGKDVGTRQIVAGIASMTKYLLDGNPSSMEGMNVCAVINMAPRKLMGLESHGMILAAHNSADDRIRLVACMGVEPGAKVG